MKKSLRIASILLVLVLVTSCFVGGTFAKYITNAPEASDNARVAKWGVKIAAIGADAFKTEYATDDDSYDGDISVESSTEEKVVAPGTEGTFAGIHVTGTPEVAVRITSTADLDLGDKWVVDGAYYCPLVITVNGNEYYGMDYTSAADFEAAVEADIISANGDYAPNTDLSTVAGFNGDFSWRWDFEVNDGTQTDAKDTALGDAAADDNAATIKLTVGTTVEQID